MDNHQTSVVEYSDTAILEAAANSLDQYALRLATAVAYAKQGRVEYLRRCAREREVIERRGLGPLLKREDAKAIIFLRSLGEAPYYGPKHDQWAGSNSSSYGWEWWYIAAAGNQHAKRILSECHGRLWGGTGTGHLS